MGVGRLLVGAVQMMGRSMRLRSSRLWDWGSVVYGLPADGERFTVRNNATSCGEQSPEPGPAGMESRSSKQTGERGSTWRWSVIWSYLLALGISFMPFAI